MKKYIFPVAVLWFYFFTLNSCNTASPEKYFDLAVLNANTLTSFADNGPRNEFASPPATATAVKDVYAPMKRKELSGIKIKFLEEDFAKLKSLQQTEDAKNILQSSRALYEFVLPVYKNEYVQLVKLYDDGAAVEEIRSLEEHIRLKYYQHFSGLYNNLITNGKVYAKKNNITVQWDIKATPDL